MEKVKLISGRSNPELAKSVADNLQLTLTDVIYKDFANTETEVEIKENIRGYHVYIIQTGGCYQGRSINDHLVELFAIIDACKRSSAESISIITPSYPYARSDKKIESRTCIMGSCMAFILEKLGVKRIIALGLHAGQIQGFSQIAFDNLYAIKLHTDNLFETIFVGMTHDKINEKYVIVSPDIGGIKRVEAYANKLGMHHVIMHKHRNYNKPGTVLSSELIGGADKIKGKICIIIDDIMDSMGTINSASIELMKYGATEIIAIATHGILSGEAINRINNNNAISKVIVTNTLPQTINQTKCNKLVIVDTSNLFAEVIKRIETGGSISELFK